MFTLTSRNFTHGFLDDFEPDAHDMPLEAILNDNGVVWPV